MDMIIREISTKAAVSLVMSHHYSRRAVGAKHAFGLFVDGLMSGCVMYSQPASYTLCNGVCGPDFREFVIELSRLVIVTDLKNAASMLVGNTLRRLGNKIVVSYADCNDHVGHVGYVYQATNWLYTGKGSAEPKWINPDTGEVVSYTRRHIDDKAARLGKSWKDLRKERQSGKHRYVTFAGDKRFKKKALASLRYKILPYPKGDTRRHSPDDVEMLFSEDA